MKNSKLNIKKLKNDIQISKIIVKSNQRFQKETVFDGRLMSLVVQYYMIY